jgi:hypothetical protein
MRAPGLPGELRGPVTAAVARKVFGGVGAMLPTNEDSLMLKELRILVRGEAQRASGGSSGLVIGFRRNVLGLDE